MKKLLAISVSMVLTLCSFAVFCPQSALAQDTGYDITSYNTNIQIGQDNTYHISETIAADFHEQRHGIYRYIPYRQSMQWFINGITYDRIYNTPVKSIHVQNDPFVSYSDNNYNMVIQIGDKNQYITGNKVYKISYDHVLGNDKLDSLDFVYYNLIGTDWDCNIDNVTFSVALPKDFDASKIVFFSGSAGSTAKAPVTYSVEGNTISGRLNSALKPGEGLTLQIDLPEGYFQVPAPFPWQNVLIIIALLIALLAIVLFYRFGRDDPLVTPVEFYAPEGITSAEAGYIIDTSVDSKDVVSLVLYWASKGYLSIERIENDDFKLTKLKDIEPQANNYEVYMFGELFAGRDTVKISQLREKFYETITNTQKLVADHYSTKNNSLYSSGSKALGWMVRIFSAMLIGLSIFIPSYESTYSVSGAMIISAIGMAIVMLALILMAITLVRWQGMTRLKRWSSLITSIILIIFVLILYLTYMIQMDMGIAGIVIAADMVLLNIIGVVMRKRTMRGSELLGKILGFKNFLERAEKSRIESLVEQNPSYFYDVLPYAYVLGVTDKWAKNFEGIAMRPPDWYHDSYGRIDTFSPLIFQAAIFNSMMSMRSAMVSVPGKQGASGGFGGGGFGGGGFSGGGFGGGGGGSW